MDEAPAIAGLDKPDGIGRQRQVVVGGRNEDPGNGRELMGRRCGSIRGGRGRAVEPLQPRPHAPHGLLDTRGRQRLYQIVGRVDLKRGRGVVRIPRREHNGRAGAGVFACAQPRPPRDFNAVDVRQSHVETQQIRTCAVECRQDLGSGRAFADGADLAGLEEGAEMPARTRLVIGDQSAQHRKCGACGLTRGVMVHGVIMSSRPLAPLTASPSAWAGPGSSVRTHPWAGRRRQAG